MRLGPLLPLASLFPRIATINAVRLTATFPVSPSPDGGGAACVLNVGELGYDWINSLCTEQTA